MEKSLTLRSLAFAAAVILCPSLAGATLRVDWADGLLSVSAEATSRSQILEEIARRAGVEVVGLDALGDETVTLHVTRVTVLEVLRRVLDHVPAVVVEERTPDGELRVVSVRIFTRLAGRAVGAERPLAEADGDPQTVVRAAQEHETLERSDDDSVRQALWHGDDEQANTAQEVLEARDAAAMLREVLIASRSEVPEQRLRAIRLLDRAGSVDRATTVATLGEAVADEDPAIKTFAISALAVRGRAGLAKLRQAFRDADRDGRLMVLQAVGDRDRDSDLLREALEDSDPQVRQFAASRLFNSGMPEGR